MIYENSKTEGLIFYRIKILITRVEKKNKRIKK